MTMQHLVPQIRRTLSSDATSVKRFALSLRSSSRYPPVQTHIKKKQPQGIVPQWMLAGCWVMMARAAQPAAAQAHFVIEASALPSSTASPYLSPGISKPW